MDARRKERLECSSGPAGSLGVEVKIISYFGGEIRAWGLICHWELLKTTLFGSGVELWSPTVGGGGEAGMMGTREGRP